MAAHRIEIERFNVTCLVAQDQPQPERLRERLEAVAAGIGSALGDTLDALFDAHGEGVCLLRRIELDLALDADAAEPQMRAAWAQAVTLAVARRLSGDGENIVRFASRAAQLAHFLDRLASGDAWSLWYHRQYVGLCALPEAIAARTALLTDDVTGLASLQLQDGWARQRLFGMLGGAECRRVLDGFAAAGQACGQAGLTLALALPECRCAPSQIGATALELYVALRAASGVTPGRAEAALSLAVATVRASVARGDTALLDTLAASETAGHVRATVDACGVAGIDLALALQAIGANERAALVQAMDAGCTARAIEYTTYGGLFLLLDALDRVMPNDLEHWPDCQGEHAGMPAAQLLRLLVLANGLGPEHAPHILEDSLWRTLFGVPPRLHLADIARWSAALPATALAQWTRKLRVTPLPAWPATPPKVSRVLGRATNAMLAAFARRLSGFAGASPAYLRANFLDIGARVEHADGVLTVTMARAPLDVILGMSMLSNATLELAWLVSPTVHLRRSFE